jgi:hypothetical protein
MTGTVDGEVLILHLLMLIPVLSVLKDDAQLLQKVISSYSGCY